MCAHHPIVTSNSNIQEYHELQGLQVFPNFSNFHRFEVRESQTRTHSRRTEKHSQVAHTYWSDGIWRSVVAVEIRQGNKSWSSRLYFNRIKARTCHDKKQDYHVQLMGQCSKKNPRKIKKNKYTFFFPTHQKNWKCGWSINQCPNRIHGELYHFIWPSLPWLPRTA